MAVNGAGVARLVVLPDILQQCLSGDCLPRRAHQHVNHFDDDDLFFVCIGFGV